MYYRYQRIKIITILPSFKTILYYSNNSLSSKLFHTTTATSGTILEIPTTATGVKPDLKLLQKLRQETSISLSKAKEALVKHNNDYNEAKEWLIEDSKISGLKKAEKLKDRIAKEGLIGVVLTKNFETNNDLLKTRGAIVELSCETDFVSRNLLFQQLIAQIASTTLFLSDDTITNENNNGENKISTTKVSNNKIIINPISPSVLNALPLLPHPSSNSINNNSNTTTIQQSIMDMISKLGENIVLRRAEVVRLKCNGNNYDGYSDRSLDNNSIILTGGYVHGGDLTTGRIGGLVVVEVLGQNFNQSLDLINKLIKNIARQIVGCNPKYIEDDDKIITSEILGNYNNKDEFLKDNVLLYQDFLFGGGTVKQVLGNFKNMFGAEIKILDFKRWECGEEI